MQHPKVEICSVSSLRPYANNARTHSKSQVAQMARSIERFGFTNPILTDDDDGIIAGHGRVEAAKILGFEQVPTIRLSHLNDADRRAYILADNKLAENAGWDDELMAIELQGLININFDMDVIGFSTTELDIIIDGSLEKGPVSADQQLATVPDLSAGPATTRRGDLWSLGDHKLLCGDARSKESVTELCADKNNGIETISLLFTDPPYNVKIDGHVGGLGKIRHREFAEASGEMSSAKFIEFLIQTLSAAASVLCDGTIAYVCMDWRHMGELLEAGNTVFDELRNLCIWNKTNGGMGTFYRSKHELIFVFK